MITNFIKEELSKIKEKEYVSFNHTIIEESSLFKEGIRIASIESGILEICGHSPLRRWEFSKNLFTKWCDENNIEYAYNEIKKIYHLRNKKTEKKVEITVLMTNPLENTARGFTTIIKN